MKLNMCLKQIFLGINLVLVVGGAALVIGGGKECTGYVAHEWGTFTSVQGGDGVLLDWRPLETSRLPNFVYNWNHPGLNRQPGAPLGPKTAMVTLQRMETPVIYFYSPRKQSVDVSVQFPHGFITEWYPQAAEIGPSTVPIPPTLAKMDSWVHQVGVSPAFTFASLMARGPIKESRVRWTHVDILPQKQNPSVAGALPMDRSGSHYFAARETDSDYLQTGSLAATNPAPESEKFIFYRGVGSFATPLQVTMASDNEAVLVNMGQEALEHLFVLELQGEAGNFIYVDQLAPGQQRRIALQSNSMEREKLSHQLRERMAESLMSAGLYAREARAMIKTWTDSWFQEDGVRVLYVLPRAWTDRTLLLALDPAPRALERVMVGRAEVILPSVQQQLTEMLLKASGGDVKARAEAVKEFKKLGRFGEPALRLVIKGERPEVGNTGWELLHAAAAPPSETAKAF
jgi:hypothetical protein